MTPFSIPRRWRKGSFNRPGICRFGFDCRDPDRKSHCGSETAVSCCHIFSKPLLTFNIVDGDPIPTAKPWLYEVEPRMTVLRLLLFPKQPLWERLGGKALTTFSRRKSQQKEGSRIELVLASSVERCRRLRGLVKLIE